MAEEVLTKEIDNYIENYQSRKIIIDCQSKRIDTKINFRKFNLKDKAEKEEEVKENLFNKTKINLGYHQKIKSSNEFEAKFLRTK